MKLKQKITVISFATLFICLTINCQDKNKIFMPGAIWPDTEGRHINAHGGGILFYNGTYYWFGESRLPRSEKERTRYGVSCYSSEDLLNWKNQGLALRVINDTASLLLPGCVIERPKVIYNRKTGKFVMWFHHELKGQGYRAALTGVAVKEGLFVRRDFVGGQMARDMTIFVDKNGKAYHIHSSEENLTLHFSELTDDYLDFTGRYVRVLPGESNEAPAIFFSKGKYFMFSSGTTGWKPNPARLSIANDLFGEWKTLGNPCRGSEEENKITFGSQSTHILPVNGKKSAFIYMGDRWTPENLADSRHIWLPIEWEKGNPVLKWYPEWSLETLKQFLFHSGKL